jgi:hypothetical protein
MRYRELFAERDFTALLVADVLSIVGSYLSRLAVSALVFARTDSVALTAVSFAVSYAPYLFSPWLSTYADRFAGRPILIACDLARAVLTLVVVLPGLPMPVLLTTLFVVSACRIPFGAARLALLAQILTPRAFPAGNALVSSARQHHRHQTSHRLRRSDVRGLRTDRHPVPVEAPSILDRQAWRRWRAGEPARHDLGERPRGSACGDR